MIVDPALISRRFYSVAKSMLRLRFLWGFYGVFMGFLWGFWGNAIGFFIVGVYNHIIPFDFGFGFWFWLLPFAFCLLILVLPLAFAFAVAFKLLPRTRRSNLKALATAKKRDLYT